MAPEPGRRRARRELTAQNDAAGQAVVACPAGRAHQTVAVLSSCRAIRRARRASVRRIFRGATSAQQLQPRTPRPSRSCCLMTAIWGSVLSVVTGGHRGFRVGAGERGVARARPVGPRRGAVRGSGWLVPRVIATSDRRPSSATARAISPGRVGDGALAARSPAGRACLRAVTHHQDRRPAGLPRGADEHGGVPGRCSSAGAQIGPGWGRFRWRRRTC